MAMLCMYGTKECDDCMWCHLDFEETMCPQCKAEGYVFYRDQFGDIFGCDKCVATAEILGGKC